MPYSYALLYYSNLVWPSQNSQKYCYTHLLKSKLIHAGSQWSLGKTLNRLVCWLRLTKLTFEWLGGGSTVMKQLVHHMKITVRGIIITCKWGKAI